MSASDDLCRSMSATTRSTSVPFVERMCVGAHARLGSQSRPRGCFHSSHNQRTKESGLPGSSSPLFGAGYLKRFMDSINVSLEEMSSAFF